ncbi:hypothetical protein COCOBI_11-2220 [Coccomyxa sp. Obi]|nr:hypothetical protein COCOBI_11-2220 [Coccomyxa sp. Obi]
MGQHQLVKELQFPCSEAGERVVGLVLDAIAGRRSWESLFLGAEAPQKLAGVPVNERGDVQCPACQGTSSARHCGSPLSSSPACWRLPDERGQYKWLSTTALDQLKASEAWLAPALRIQCMRKLLMRAHHNTMLSGDMQPSEITTSFASSEQEMSCMHGAVICLGPGMQEMLNRLKLTFEVQWYTDIMVVQASNAADMGRGDRQARAQAARLPQYELHVLVAQPHAQEKAPRSPVQQPRMVLDGEELDSAMVNSLLEMASSKTDQSSTSASAPSRTVNAPALPSSGRTQPEAQSAACTTADRAAVVADQVCGATEAGFRRLLGATAQQCSAPEASSAPKHSQSLTPPTQAQRALTKRAVETLLQPLRRTKPSMGPISSMLSGSSKQAPMADASEAAMHAQLSAQIASLAKAVINQQHPGHDASPVPGQTSGQPKSRAQQHTPLTNGSACSGKHDSTPESGDQSKKQPRPSLEDMRLSLLQKISGLPPGLSGGLSGRVGRAHKPAVSETVATQPLGKRQPAVSRSAATWPLRRKEPATVSQSAAPETLPHEELELPQCSGQACRNQSGDSNAKASGGREFLKQAVRLPSGIHRHPPRISHLQQLASLLRKQHTSESAADVQEAAGGGSSSRDSGSWQDMPSGAIPAESLPPRRHTKPARLRAASAVASAEVRMHPEPDDSLAAPAGHLAQSDSGRPPTASAFAPAKAVTHREPGIVPPAQRMEQEPSSLPTTSSNAHQAPEQLRRRARQVEPESRARSNNTSMAAEPAHMRDASEAAAAMNPPLQQRNSSRPRQSTSIAPARRISHLEMESSIVGESCRQEPPMPAAKPSGRGGRPRGRGHHGRGRSRASKWPRSVTPPAPRAQPGRKRAAAEGDATPDFFTVKRPRTKRNVVRNQGLQTAWSPPKGWLACLVAAPEHEALAAAALDNRHPVLAPSPVQLPQPQVPSTMPDPSALGTSQSRVVAAVARVSPRQMALSRASLLDLLGNAAPLDAQVPPTTAEVSASAGGAHGSPAAAADAAADVDSGAVKAGAAGTDPSGEGAAAGELAAADAGCSVEISVSGQEGSEGCTAVLNSIGAAPEASGVTVPVETMEAAKGMRLKKRRKKVLQETISPSLSPPGAFGRAVFGRKKRGNDDVTSYNEKKLRQQRWKAEQKELQERRQRRRASKAEHGTETDDTAYACGDRTQLLMRLLPNHGINDGHAGFRMSVLCSTVLADAGSLMSLNLDSCQKRLVAGLEQSCSRTLSKADEAALRTHKEELDRLAAYLNSPNDSPLQKEGARRRRKPGRPRKTLRLASTPVAADASEAEPSSAPEPSLAQIPGTQPAALQLPNIAARRRGPKPGRRPKKPAAKFADPTALSAQSGEDAASAGVSVGAAAAVSSPATSASAGDLLADARGASGCVTSALDAVTELCRDVNPPGYASSDGTTPTRPILAGRSRLHVSSGVPPSPGALQQADVPAAERGSREDPADAETADDVTSSGAPRKRVEKEQPPVTEVSPAALSAGPEIAMESVPTETAHEAVRQQEETPSGPHKPSNQNGEERNAGNGVGDTAAEAKVPGTPGEPAVQQGEPVAAGAQLPAAEERPAKRKRGRPPSGKNKRARSSAASAPLGTAEQPEIGGTKISATEPVLAPSTAGPEAATDTAVAATAPRPAAQKQQGEGTDPEPAKTAVAPGSATGAVAAAVQRKRGRPPGSKNKGRATAPLPAAQKQRGGGADPQPAKSASAPGSATGALAAAVPVVAQSAAAEDAEEPERPRAPEQAKLARKKKGASAAEPEQPGSAQQAKKTGKEERSAGAVAPGASPEKTRRSVQQLRGGGAADGSATGAQQKTGGAGAVSHTKAPAVVSQQTQASAEAADGKRGPARMAANDYRLMKVRRFATWKDIYSRVP